MGMELMRIKLFVTIDRRMCWTLRRWIELPSETFFRVLCIEVQGYFKFLYFKLKKNRNLYKTHHVPRIFYAFFILIYSLYYVHNVGKWNDLFSEAVHVVFANVQLQIVAGFSKARRIGWRILLGKSTPFYMRQTGICRFSNELELRKVTLPRTLPICLRNLEQFQIIW